MFENIRTEIQTRTTCPESECVQGRNDTGICFNCRGTGWIYEWESWESLLRTSGNWNDD